MKNLQFFRRGSSLTKEEFDELLTKLGRNFPEDYLFFLYRYNGGFMPEYAALTLDNRETVLLKELLSLTEGTTSRKLTETSNREAVDPDYFEIGSDTLGNGFLIYLGATRALPTAAFKWSQLLLFNKTPTKLEFGSIHLHDKKKSRRQPGDRYDPLVFIARSFTDFIYNLRLIDPEHKDQFDFIGEHGTFSDLLNFLAQNNINSKNAYERTIVQECARHGNLELLEKCHFHGADFSGAMNYAFLNEQPEVIKFLIGLGIDINERDGSGKTPLDYMISYSKEFNTVVRSLGAKTSQELEDEA